MKGKSFAQPSLRTTLLYFLLINFTLTHYSLYAVTDWTMLIYVQANNNLASFAHKNFSDMVSVGSNNNITTLVQWYQPGSKGIWRYKIEKDRMVLDECYQNSDTDGSKASDLVDAMHWAASRYPANKYSLILWNHGIGILDPVWGHQRQHSKDIFAVDPTIIGASQRIQIGGITTDEETALPLESNLDTLMTSTRGILFNEHTKTYMDNYNLSSALHQIKSSVLHNKKIDLLGMDACLMAMVEVGYLARDCAHYLVASQEVELGYGWSYQPVLQTIANKTLSPLQAAQLIVQVYEAYYNPKVQFYTQSAINLDNMAIIKDSIDHVINALRTCQHYDHKTFTNLARQARSTCLQFSAANYIDLYTFFTELLKNTDGLNTSTKGLVDLKNALKQGMGLIEQTVVANAAGKNLGRAKGLSIYFPQGRIDDSYHRTDFAHDGQWLGFIKEMVGA